jgi:hypothetical protein
MFSNLVTNVIILTPGFLSSYHIKFISSFKGANEICNSLDMVFHHIGADSF